MELILKSFWFLLPAYAATSVPVFARGIKFLDFPVDFNKRINGEPVFGRNKTYRGFFFGTLSAVIICYLQRLLYDFGYFRSISLVDYSSINFVFFGFLMGFGSLFGDLVKSFFKRRLKIPEGKFWFPFDQVDYAAGGIVFVLGYFKPEVEIVFAMLLLSFFLHLAFVKLAFFVGIRKY